MRRGSTPTMGLGCFLEAGGQHMAGWRHPSANAHASLDLPFIAEMAQLCERGLMDAVFLPDSLAPWVGDLDVMSRTTRGEHFEPTTLLAALSSVTERIGLVATATTTYNEPYHVARKFASLDHLSGGRTGWNLVTSLVPSESRSFGTAPFPSREERYERAEEFIGVVKRLWDSYSDGAMLRDETTGRFYDPGELRLTEHRGKHFAVRGPLNLSRPPQGHPVVFQAGNSPRGRDFAARHGEVLFTAQSDLGEAKDYYRDIKERASAVGRDPDHVHIWRGFAPLIAATQAEADAMMEELNGLVHEDVMWDLVKGPLAEVDFSGRTLDDPLPELADTEDSRQDLLHGMAGLNRPTIREIALQAAGAGVVVGSPERIADELQEWFEAPATDGFLLSFPFLPSNLRLFVDEVVPELQRRGLYRTEYAGLTLRENLGLPRPKEVWR
ncbi:LLM class flavin-dependent oxidoreductase [Streptomyces griseus]|uniref:LLM class flavin-dependent oxidoreductase n=2 Tax=Streptomyces TaxID=1883 RepID=UPI001360CD9A|nr:NtaA/DmoA family FMN-dependent monooxygenase [Streptomyces sp. SID724]